MTTTHRTRTSRAPDAALVPRRRRTPGQALAGLGAGLALLAGVVGVPLVLWVVAPIGLPDTWPVWSEVVHIVMRPDDGRLAVAAIRLVAWVAWAAFTWAVVIETHAALRNTTAPQVHPLGIVQRAAATLVGAVLLTLAAPAYSTVATPDTVAVQVVPDAGGHAAVRPTHSSPVGVGERTVARVPRAEGRLPVVTVQDGDSLWFIAERHLGAGARYPEILALNVGRPQADGHALTDAHDIEPGWQLLLPANAVNVPATAQPATAAADPTPASVAVVPGDTLWDLAQTHLDDGDRYPEIVALNAGVPQPDGDTLRDPDLIRPGWILTLPAAGGAVQPDAAAAEPEAAAPVPDAGAGVVVEPDAAPPAGSEAPDPDASSAVPPQVAISQPDALDRVPDTDVMQPDALRDGPAVVPDAVHAAPDADAAAAVNVDVEPDAASTPTGLVLGLTTLAAAGLIGELARRRLLQRRVRRTGQRIARPAVGSRADDAERTWRATPTPLSLAQLRTALDVVAAGCFTAERDLPRLGAIEVGPVRVVLHMVEDDARPVAPFTGDGPATWVASTATLAALDPVDGPAAPEPYPALVAVGHTGHSTVLVNLEAAGTLRMIGDADATAGVLRAIATAHRTDHAQVLARAPLERSAR